MGLLGGTMLLVSVARLINDLAKGERKTGYVIVTKDRGRLRTRYRILCSDRRPDESNSSSDKKDNDQGMETFLSVQARNPQLFAQKLLQRYAKRSNLGEWFSLNKKQLQDLEEIMILIYATTG